VEEAQKDQMEKLRALREDTNLTPDQKREKFQAAREDMSKKMKGILSAEQYDKWEKMTAASRGGEGKKGKKKTDN
jgi:cyclopropane fatty-acyl-phospholipid synthase-like methyltransferase